jgi:hypothetical protein
MRKFLNISLSFLMIFTLAFATIETVDSEPAFADASKAFDCKASNGDLYGYQTAWNTSSIGITRFNVETGTTTNVKSFTKLGNTRVKNFDNIAASAMDDQGHLFVFARKDNKVTPYYLASDSTQGVKVGKSLDANSVIDAATYFEYGGNKYMVAANGFFAGDVSGWSMPSGYNYAGVPGTWSSVSFNANTSGVTAKLAKTDDIAWLVDGSGYPALNGTSPSFVGYDIETQKVVLGYITSKSGNTFNITVKDYPLNRSGWDQSTRVGAVFAFGGSEVYAIHNGTGNVRKITYDGSSFGWGSNLGNMTVTSSNDGAACHTGTPDQYWEPTASIVGTSTCVGEGKKLQVKLANPSLVGKNGAKAIHTATYSSTDGQSGTLYSFTQDIGSTVTYYPGPAFANGSVVTVNYTITNASDSTEVRSGTLTKTVNASECVTTPISPDSSYSQTLGTCSSSAPNATRTSTLSITNDSDATAYYKVEYSLNGGSSYTTASANLSVGAGATNTSISQAVSNGESISWRITASDMDGEYGGLTPQNLTASDTVSCELNVEITRGGLGCTTTYGAYGVGTSFSTLTITNNESSSIFFYKESSVDGGSTWGVAQSGTLAAGADFSMGSGRISDGNRQQFRYKIGTDSADAAAKDWTYTTFTDVANCPHEIDTSVTTEIGACGATGSNKQVVTFNANNDGGSAEISAHFHLQVSINGGDFTTVEGWDSKEVAAGGSESYALTLTDGDTVDFQYAVQNEAYTTTPSSFTDVSYTGDAAVYTVSCPSVTIDTTVSVANGTCSGTTFGFMPQVFTMNNGSGADTVAYYRVQYNKNSAGWVTAVENQSVDINSSQTYTLEDLIVGDTIAWRYYALNSSLAIPANGVDPVSDSDYTTVSSPPTPGDGCNTAATSSSTSLGTCSGASVDSTLSIDINTYTDNFENGDNISTTPLKYYVQYQIDDGDWTDHTTESAAFGSGSGRDLVNATATFTQAVPDGSTINWRYQAKYDDGSFADIADAPVISANNGEAVECPYINPTASSAIGSCLQSDGSNNDGPATSTFTMQNAGATRNAYFFVEYKINDGDWIEKDTNKQVAADATETLTVDVPHGSTITWRYKSSITPRDFSTGSYTTLDESAAVNCPVLVVTATLTPTASCQDGVFTSFITIQNLDSSNVSGFIQAYYSFDNSTWTAATFSGADVTDLEIQDNTAKTLDGVVVPGGSTIYWRYEERLPSASFTNTYVTTGPNSTPLSVTADCPNLDPSASVTLGACSGGSKSSTLTIDNSLSNIPGFFKVEYRFDDGAWGEAASNDEVAGGASATFSVNVPNGSYVTWRYKITDTSDTFTEDYILTASSESVACYTTGNDFTTSIATGCGYPDAKANFFASVPLDVQSASFFEVKYRTDMGGPFISLGSTLVGPGETIAIGDISVPYGSSIQWMYKVTAEEGADGTFISTDVLTPEYESNDPCKPDPPVTTTIPTIEPIFKPIITNVRTCNDDGTASYGLTVDNTQSNVSLGITTLMKIDNVTVVNTDYLVNSGESKFITTVASVPEGSYYRIKFFVSDGAGGGTSVGVFKKITDCYEDTSDSTTTTTSPPSTTPGSEGPQPVCDTGFDGTCDTPLTGEEGNDFFEWDDYDEQVYLTDGSYVVQYIYSEDELPIAETGIFEDLYVFYFVVFSTASVVLLNWRPRRRKS